MGDWIKSILLGLFTNFLWELIVGALVGSAVVYLKARWGKWAGPVTYGLFVFVLWFVLGFALTGQPPLAKTQPQVTIDNVEQNVRAWMDEFELGVKKQDDDTSYFTFEVQLPDNQGVTIQRLKNREKWLLVSSRLSFDPLAIKEYNSLSENQRKTLIETITVELSRTNLQYKFEFPKLVLIEAAIPITGNLTEDTLLNTIHDVDDGISIAKNTLLLNIERTVPK